MNKLTLVDEYLNYQRKYEKEYGSNTIVLMECGSFFEIYDYPSEDGTEEKIYKIADMINLNVSRKKNKSNAEHYSLMAGFPNHSYEKWRDILLKNNYTIIKIEQDSHGTKNPKRNVTEIISPGVNLDSTNYSNNLISIYLEEISCNGKKILWGGVSSMDINTGDNIIYDIHGTPSDESYTLDEIFRFIQTYNPKEIIINTNNISQSQEDIISYLEINDRNILYNNYNHKKNLLKINSIKTLLEKLFPNYGLLDIIDFLDLDYKIWGMNSYILLLQFVFEHNENIVKNMKKPVIWDDSNHLILSYDTINQLNIIQDKTNMNKKLDSVMNLLDNTSTAFGRRMFRYNIGHPIINIETLNKHYHIIDCLSDKYIDLEKILKKINDIERYHRRITIGVLDPCTFINLDNSYRYILKLYETINSFKNTDLSSLLPDTNTLDKFNQFMNTYNLQLNMEHILNSRQDNIKKSIFNTGFNNEIDILQNKIDNRIEYFKSLCVRLSRFIDADQHNIVKLKTTDKDGHFFTVTKAKGKILKQKLSTIKTIQWEYVHTSLSNDTSDITQMTQITQICQLNTNDLNIKQLTGHMKISSPTIKQYSERLHFYYIKMNKLCIEEFKKILTLYDEQYSNILKKIVESVAYIDVSVSNTKSAIINNYTKPIIVKSEGKDIQSFIDCKDLRHPLIEKLNTRVEYIPNDISLGKSLFNLDKPTTNGMLLYGVNAVGKSSTMKSVGISIIMAQAGMYVPASEFYYYPYKYIFTRISGNDNIFKGQSTFAVEMSELRSILKRVNKNSLVLGDELCSGTETTSAIALVSAGIITLDKSNCNFIFATHLHKLSTMNRITCLEKVKSYHMETIYDEDNEILIYNRKLKHGSGNSIYGLEVAKSMNLDKEFIQLADEIRREELNIQTDIINSKTSSYNSNIIIDKCAVCSKQTDDIHHIKFQEQADTNNMIDHHHKNIAHNLVQLCVDCHYKVHHNNLIIRGYIQTNKGIQLDYEYVSTKQSHTKKRKFNKQQVEIVLSYKTKCNNNRTEAQKLIELDKHIKISKPVIKKIWEGIY